MIAKEGENPFEYLSSFFGAYLSGCSERDDKEKKEEEEKEEARKRAESFSLF